MSLPHTITLWLDRLKDDCSAAAQNLWDAYFQQLVNIARKELPREHRRMADEEDVALSAFKSFCHGIRAGRFQHLVNRESLWPLLVVLTKNKAKDAARFETRRKRGGGGKKEELWEDVLSTEPTPEFVAQLAEEMKRLLDNVKQTGDNQLRDIVLWSLEGYTTNEIAEQLDCSMRTVQRKLKIVRRLWIKDTDE